MKTKVASLRRADARTQTFLAACLAALLCCWWGVTSALAQEEEAPERIEVVDVVELEAPAPVRAESAELPAAEVPGAPDVEAPLAPELPAPAVTREALEAEALPTPDPAGAPILTEAPPAVVADMEVREVPDGALPALAGESAGVAITPEAVAVSSPGQPITLQLRTDSPLVTADRIHAVRVFVNGAPYTQNVNLDVANGQVTLTPAQDLPPGRYDVELETETGVTHLRVFSPPPYENPRETEVVATVAASDDPALRAHIEQELQRLPNNIALNFSPNYIVGQTVVANLRAAPNQYYAWRVNGREVAYGQGNHRFVYTFKTPGTHVFSYTVKSHGEIEFSGLQAVEVTARPSRVYAYRAGENAVLTAPPGYTTYTWELNGVVLGTGRTLETVFPERGAYRIAIIAEKLEASHFEEDSATLYEYAVSVN